MNFLVFIFLIALTSPAFGVIDDAFLEAKGFHKGVRIYKNHDKPGVEKCEDILVFDPRYTKEKIYLSHLNEVNSQPVIDFFEKNPEATLQLLGRGGMGIVFKVTTPGEMPFALKIFKSGYEYFAENTKAIFEVLANDPTALSHTPKIVLGEKGSDLGYLEMELLQGLPLLKYLGFSRKFYRKPYFHHIQFEWSHFLIKEMTLSLNSMHRNHIVMNDVKPENFFVEQMGLGGKPVSVRIFDFDGAVIEGKKGYYYAHTAGFVAPELSSAIKLKNKDFVSQCVHDLHALRLTFQQVLLDRYFFENNIPHEKSISLEIKKKSAYSVDPRVPELLSVIAYYEFQSTTEILDALDVAKKSYEQKDLDLFYHWFWKTHLRRMWHNDFLGLLNNSDELSQAYERGALK